MLAHGIYLHGFASGPRTAKGTALGTALGAAVASWTIPDQEGGDFRGMTLDTMRMRILATVAALPDDGAPLLVVGSSLGGWMAAWLLADGALPRARGAVLIAPAFAFTSRWEERLGPAGLAHWRARGALPFHHHGSGCEQPLGVGFLDSCQGRPEIPDLPVMPTAIIHGRGDDTVPCSVSREAAQRHPHVDLHLCDGDHRLVDPWHSELIAWACRDVLRRI